MSKDTAAISKRLCAIINNLWKFQLLRVKFPWDIEKKKKKKKTRRGLDWFPLGYLHLCLIRLPNQNRVLNKQNRELKESTTGLCPGVPVYRGNNHCTPFFTNLCLAVEHCWVFCIGSCEPVHEDRTHDGNGNVTEHKIMTVHSRYNS